MWLDIAIGIIAAYVILWGMAFLLYGISCAIGHMLAWFIDHF